MVQLLLSSTLTFVLSSVQAYSGLQVQPSNELALTHWEQQTQSVTSTYAIDVDDYPTGPLNATAWALIYTYPLAIFANFAGAVLQDHSVNTIVHQRALASPSDPGVVKPNVDTLYSRVVLDLSRDDVILTVPHVGSDRYWNYPVYDPFGNVIAEIGIANANKAGRYLIRRADDAFAAPGYEDTILPGNASHDFQGVVNLPGSYGTMLIRLLLVANTTADVDAVHAIQDASSLVPIPRITQAQEAVQAPPLDTLALDGTFLGVSGPQKQLRFAAGLVQYSQPIEYSDRYRVASILAQAGLYNDRFQANPRVNLTDAALIANQSISSDINSPAHIRAQGNDYVLQIEEYQGYYGKHYAIAAYVALAGYQQLTVKQALYPGFQGLGFASLYTLPSNSSWLFTFSGKPQLHKTGFWSLSVYGSDQYLIPNALDRFEVGDRTYSLTYEDGTYVYGPQADPSRDGQFQILLQPADIVPPKNWTKNWLPAEETFFMLLRWYVPEAAMTNGSYIYPKVQNISHIIS